MPFEDHYNWAKAQESSEDDYCPTYEPSGEAGFVDLCVAAARPMRQQQTRENEAFEKHPNTNGNFSCTVNPVTYNRAQGG